jgi:hypothetical protein
VIPETHGISDSENDNGSDEKEEHINTESGGVSNKLVAKYRLISCFKKNVLMCMILGSTLLNLVS